MPPWARGVEVGTRERTQGRRGGRGFSGCEGAVGVCVRVALLAIRGCKIGDPSRVPTPTSPRSPSRVPGTARPCTGHPRSRCCDLNWPYSGLRMRVGAAQDTLSRFLPTAPLRNAPPRTAAIGHHARTDRAENAKPAPPQFKSDVAARHSSTASMGKRPDRLFPSSYRAYGHGSGRTWAPRCPTRW